ncbi:Ras-related protein [Schistosoma japonicum]|uniref:RAB39, member RAS oncogene family n=1 Tax=Schistosoma japonicum TaxID=6182 RepID=Q86EN0_SCHJA|nr:SJCHGC06552 protein [Schistosoma japonicum]KAH8857747.1 Ras-related protein Rab-39A [Schistosoma japonicum]TNN05600.1 Ras-related protein [Schistosoma japonicum]TNN05601.1 Ras-related protein [Schistosoma japonicum]CAX69977.1 RAB39, member RAS oncogene family [Schistosoma japonicum]
MLPYFDYQFRVIIIGDSMVGKSSLMKSFVEGNFSPVSDPTIGVDFFSRTVRIQEEVFVKLQLWDTAGQEKFRSITASYYRNCVGVIIVFDLTDRETFDHISDWYEEARVSIKCSAPVFIVVGHKADRRDERQVTKIEAQSLAQRLGDYAYIETSSLTGQNIEKTFELLAEGIYTNVIKGSYNELCAGGVWDGVKQGHNAALAASLANRSIHFNQDEPKTHGDCC